MIVDSIISSVVGYFTSLSVSSKWGYPKVTLIEADELKEPTGVSVEIDATESVDLTISKTVISHASETRRVFMDGTKVNPYSVTISGTVDVSKVADLQELASNDTWMWISHSKTMGGMYHNTEGGNPLTLSGMAKIISDPMGAVNGVVNDAKEFLGLPTEATDYSLLYSDCKLYVIRNITVNDSGFMNTVDVSIDLYEVVMFEMDIEKKFGVSNSSGKKKQKATKDEKKKETTPPPLDTTATK